MATFADRVRETTTTTGTGTYSLAGPATGFRGFVAGLGNNGECYYCCTDGTDWEVGLGTVTDAATDTLSRDSILASSNAGAAVNWSAGSKEIFCVAPGDWLDTVLTSANGIAVADLTVKTTPVSADQLLILDSEDSDAPKLAAWADLIGPPGAAGADGVDGADGTDGVMASIVAGTGIAVDATDPANPVVSATGGGGGGLTWATTYTADASNKAVTLTVGQVKPINLSAAGLNGNVIVSLPATPSAGDQCAVVVIAKATAVGSFAQAPGYCAEFATGSNLNGDSYTQVATGSGKWGLWLAGERLDLIYDGSKWLVEQDGRRALGADAYRTTDISTSTANTWTACEFSAEREDIGGVYDAASTYLFQVKRDGRYAGVIACTSLGDLADGNSYQVRAYSAAASAAYAIQHFFNAVASAKGRAVVPFSFVRAAGDSFTPQFLSAATNAGIDATDAQGFVSHFACYEVLN